MLRLIKVVFVLAVVVFGVFYFFDYDWFGDLSLGSQK